MSGNKSVSKTKSESEKPQSFMFQDAIWSKLGKEMFINTEGKVKILPKFDIFIFIFLLSVIGMIFIADQEMQYFLLIGIAMGALIIWSIKQILFHDVPFWIYVSWAILAASFFISIYTVYSLWGLIALYL